MLIVTTATGAKFRDPCLGLAVNTLHIRTHLIFLKTLKQLFPLPPSPLFVGEETETQRV